MDLKVYDKKDFPAYLPKLNALYDDLFTGGKGFRAKLIQWFGADLNIAPSTQQLLAQTIEFIHNASLLHDDLVDRSHLRRGKPAAWLKYNPEYAVLAGDYLLARVMVNLSSFGNIRLVQYTAEVISDLLEGEWLQDSLIHDFQISLQQLDRVHNLKTSSLFKWCIRAPFYSINRSDDKLHAVLEELGTLLGQLFQRADDLLDFNIRNDEGKAVLGDIKSGYLNSFGAFLFQDKKTERELLKKVETLEDVYSLLGGKDIFDSKWQEFDQNNQALILLYDHLVDSLKSYLQESEMGLIQHLRPLPNILYWRRV
jgi:octaprenyl-diphosphate synthase